jgi:hypothetical protein
MSIAIWPVDDVPWAGADDQVGHHHAKAVARDMTLLRRLLQAWIVTGLAGALAAQTPPLAISSGWAA